MKLKLSLWQFTFPQEIMLPIVLVCLMMALGHHVHAQNSPQDFLNAHNMARATIGVPPLIWNETLVEYAAAYAQLRAKDCAMEHSQGPYGENLAAGSWDMSAKEAVKMWLDEKPLYNTKSGACVGGGVDCMHYTQVMWQDSTRLGCARSHCSDGWTFVICNYDPPGNYEGECPY